MVSPQSVRRFIMTASITIITASGAIYGAGLKSDQELKQVRCTSLAFTLCLQQPSHLLISRDNSCDALLPCYRYIGNGTRAQRSGTKLTLFVETEANTRVHTRGHDCATRSYPFEPNPRED
jgi:hypothetical protein